MSRLSLVAGASVALISTLALGDMSSASAAVTLPALFSDNTVLQRDTPMPVWGKANPGEKVTVTLDGSKADATADAQGAWEARLPSHRAGGPYALTVVGKNTVTVNNVLVGDVWLCSGQSNMEFSLLRDKNHVETIASSTDPSLRLFKVGWAHPDTPTDDVKGNWKASDPSVSGSFSAVGYYFGRALRKSEGVPIGLIGSYVGGTPAQAWTRAEVLNGSAELTARYVTPYPALKAAHDKAMADYAVAEAKAKEDGSSPPVKPYGFWANSGLYNGMIAPLTRFPIRGVIWYQGETNTHDPIGYRTLLPAMIQDWRAQWREPQMPFLIVQLTSFGSKEGDGLAWAELREAQARTAQTIPNSAIAVTTDLGLQREIHYPNKAPVGERLALLARKIAYGEANLVASGPTYKSLSINGNKAIVTFDNVGDGLAIRGGDDAGQTVPADRLVGFTIAGADGKFVPADARIIGKDTIEVSAAGVDRPTAVRFGFANFPMVNLWNKDGLPACPFRTDGPG